MSGYQLGLHHYFPIASFHILVGSFAILLLAFICFLWQQIFGKVTVNCWFCDKDTVVSTRLKNKWTCKFCCQYNGFDKHGDYNKTLPEMYDERLNARQAVQSAAAEIDNQIAQREKLCEKCSRNQTLKCKQLAQFQPLVESNFEKEIDEYKLKLEKLYQLCSTCAETLKRYLKLQDTILRGRMMSQQKKIQSKTPGATNKMKFSATPDYELLTDTKCKKAYASLLHVAMLILVLINCAITLRNFVPSYLKVSFAYFNFFANASKSVFPILTSSQFHKVNFFANASTIIITNGLAWSIVIACFKVVKSKCGWFYLVFWILCAALMIISPKELHVNRHVLDLVEFYSGQTDYWGSSTEFSLFSFKVSYTVVWMQLHISLCFVMVIWCSVNLMHCLLTSAAKPAVQTQAASKPILLDEKQRVVAPEDGIANLKLGDNLYSDDNVADNDMADADDSKHDLSDHDLNGSLHALKLQDNFLMNDFKDPNNILGASSLPSSMHTPPPSRSSSLLSLASHNSGSASIKLNSSFSAINFARPSTELPFQRYKANSTSGCWSRSPVCSKSVATTLNHRLSRNNRAHLISELHKPLLQPARLPWLARSRTNALSSVLEKYETPNKNLLKAESEGDVSIFDSISQAGDRTFPELSDYADKPSRTPDCRHDTSSLNSSPKSTISSITSVTMKGVAEVENSRLCKWILAACLLVNLILVVLLVLEVKEMREMEQWKSKVTL